MDRTNIQDLRREPARVTQMFDRIAGRYDVMNRFMTCGLDRRWRRLAAAQAALRPGDEALDVCCGTGDLTLDLAESSPAVSVIGLDLSERMLERARRKLSARAGRDRSRAHGCTICSGALVEPDRLNGASDRATGVGSRVGFVTGNALDLPFEENRFGAVTAAFGVRNLHHLPAAFAGMLRVTRPGGRLVCLEITTPPPGLGRRFHAVWFDRCVPLLGRLITGDGSAYVYLPASVRTFPDAHGLARLLWDAGWRRVRCRRLGMGIVALHVAEKPLEPESGRAASGEYGVSPRGRSTEATGERP